MLLSLVLWYAGRIAVQRKLRWKIALKIYRKWSYLCSLCSAHYLTGFLFFIFCRCCFACLSFIEIRGSPRAVGWWYVKIQELTKLKQDSRGGWLLRLLTAGFPSYKTAHKPQLFKTHWAKGDSNWVCPHTIWAPYHWAKSAYRQCSEIPCIIKPNAQWITLVSMLSCLGSPCVCVD